MRACVLVFVVIIAACATRSSPVEWVRGGEDGTQLRWGIVGGLQFAIPPAPRGPRGLVRIFSPTLSEGKYDLVNFIAVEPVVAGVRGLSELERSALDEKPGKRLWVEEGERAGTIRKLDDGVEVLSVVVHVERFDNGAEVRMRIDRRSDRPDEIALAVWPEAKSAPIESCVLTATMGNKARARQLWLRDEVVSSLKLYGNYRGTDFAHATLFPRSKLAQTKEGDVIAAITTDEEKPADIRPVPGSNQWYWGGAKVTQYWLKRAGTARDDLQIAVNGRFMYWKMRMPVPGGIAFENFELREKFDPGQEFVFGVTRKTPAELGLTADVKPPK